MERRGLRRRSYGGVGGGRSRTGRKIPIDLLCCRVGTRCIVGRLSMRLSEGIRGIDEWVFTGGERVGVQARTILGLW
ncbi:hypothetical protein KQX54_008810 [Cotesia glomerata]|uniref:Uncharacterized protein n=1 Tax=Cotesia glomerata TaxID=32391 RepID=A0AAV7IJN5_COTGL|nr:hypothetical protein KQX54_008810 [Cotesia glomerata]